MKVSVAMTTYNGEKYIIEQLDSLKKQTRMIDQVIICDDCSSDGTVRMIEQFIQKNHLNSNWKVICNDNNLGYADNFHKAIGLCDGDIIFFADQDDIWNIDKIEIMTEQMKENSDIKVLYSDYEPYYCTEDAPVISKNVIKQMNGDGSILMQQFDKWSIYIRSEGCTMCVTKTFWDEIQKYWFSGFAHDEFVWKMALCADGLYVLHKSTLKRRLHSNNVSKKKIHSLDKRISYSENLLKTDEKMLEYAINRDIKKEKIELIKKNIECIKLRIDMMSNRKYLNIFILIIKYSKYYYSKKSILVEFLMSIKG